MTLSRVSLLTLLLAAFLVPGGLVAPMSSTASAAELAHVESELSKDDEEIRTRVLELMDRRMREFRQEMSRQLEEMLKLRGEGNEKSNRIAQLEEENARLKRMLRQLRGNAGNADDRDGNDGEDSSGPAVAFLGVGTVPAAEALARRVKSDPTQCLEVISVLEKTPAAGIGLRTGDVITSIGGKPASRENFQSVLGGKKVGDTLRMTYFQTSGDNPIQIDAQTKMANRQDFEEAIERLMARQQGEQPSDVEVAPADAKAKLGLTIEEVAAGNLTVLEVMENGNAAAAGLRSGDRLTHLGDRELETLADIRAIVGNWRVGQRGRFVYQRGDTRHSAIVALGGGEQRARVISMEEESREKKNSGGKVTFGVSVEEPENGRGLVVLEVFGGSNAAEAGIQTGDRIVNVDGTRIRSLDDLRSALGEWKPGHEAAVRYRRERTTFNSKVVLAGADGRPRLVSLEEVGGRTSAPNPAERRRGFLGVRLAEAENGLRVGEVIADTCAASMGLEVGDLLTSINGKRVKAQEDLRDTLGKLSAGDSITIEVLRSGSKKELKGTLGAAPESPQASTSNQVESSRVATAPAAVTTGRAQVVPAAAPSARPTLGIVAAEDGGNVVVDSLLEGSVLASAGIQPGDRLVDLGGHAIDGFPAVRQALGAAKLGENLTVVVERNGQRVAAVVRMGGPAKPAPSGRPVIGFELEELLDSGRVNVVAVDMGGPAASAGLKAGDRLVGFDGTTSVGLDAIRDVLSRRRPGDSVTIQVERDGRLTDLRLVLGARD